MKDEFIPQGYTITREVIAEMIHTELTEIHGLDITIGPDHKLLTDELCQQIANAWYEEPNPHPAIGDLWEDEDSVSTTWSHKLLRIFMPNMPPLEIDARIKKHQERIKYLFDADEEELPREEFIDKMAHILDINMLQSEAIYSLLMIIQDEMPEAPTDEIFQEYLEMGNLDTENTG